MKRESILAPEGWVYITPTAAIAIAFGIMGWYWATALLAIATLFLINFFRNPRHPDPHGPEVVLSPADGVVVQIRDIPDGEIREGLTKQVSIFMNVFDVHVNRAPISGKIVHYRYNPGKKLAAFADKSSSENEQNLIVVSNGPSTVAFKQIAGLLARRIVFDLSVGDEVVRGQRVGMIKFGSRVDMFLPTSANIRVSMKDRVRVGLSVIAEMDK